MPYSPAPILGDAAKLAALERAMNEVHERAVRLLQGLSRDSTLTVALREPAAQLAAGASIRAGEPVLGYCERLRFGMRRLLRPMGPHAWERAAFGVVRDQLRELEELYEDWCLMQGYVSPFDEGEPRRVGHLVVLK